MNDYRPFSEREGFVPMKVYRVDIKDTETRNKIYNQIHAFLHTPGFESSDDTFYDSVWDFVYKHHFWAEFFSKPVDEYRYMSDCAVFLRSMLLNDDPWYRVFDFVEYILNKCTHVYECEELNDIYSKEKADALTSAINRVLEESKVGYRIIDNKFVPILSDQEKEEVEKAYSTVFNEANRHVKKAINLLADREDPDYENSIKESISAVESIAKEITGKEKALNVLTQSLQLHPSFKEALDKLYNWTSKDGGIRHGKSSKSLTPDQNTAMFMLVICSSFVNYIISLNSQEHEQ